MKKLFLILLILVPFSVFARLDLSPGDRELVSKNDACLYEDGFYKKDLQINGFDNAISISFVKSQRKLYYVVIDRSNNENKLYSLYSYNCNTKKAILALHSSVFRTIFTQLPDTKNYEAIYLKEKKGGVFTLGFHNGSSCDGGSCEGLSAEDIEQNSLGYEAMINTSKKSIIIMSLKKNESSKTQKFYYK